MRPWLNWVHKWTALSGQDPPILGRVAGSQLSSRGVAAESNEESTGASRPASWELTEGQMRATRSGRCHHFE